MKVYLWSCLFLCMNLAMSASAKDTTSVNTKRKPQNIFTDAYNSVANTLSGNSPGTRDEAKIALDSKLITPAVFEKMKAGSADDYYHDMDYGISNPANIEKVKSHLEKFLPGMTAKAAQEAIAKGRNNWIVWTGGNDRFWDEFNTITLGSSDFLKTISNFPRSNEFVSYPFNRANRWKVLGLVNEPCFKGTSTVPTDPWGLYLDERDASCVADPYAEATKYPGIKTGSRGTMLKYKGKSIPFEVGSFYGRPSGVVGLRIFNNPKFDQKAADAWDPELYYTNPKYYMNPNLIKPYRIGMSCAFCHVGPNPTNPPKDFNNPTWANLNGNPGAQYFWIGRVFNWNYEKTKDNFVGQLFNGSRPGALDTSLISSDQINNPRTMNAIYDLPSRAVVAKMFGHFENLQGEELNNAQFNDLGMVRTDSVLREFYKKNSQMVISPRVLKDGADSVGVLGALNRVYVNIGLFSEHWLEGFIPVVGGDKIRPFQIGLAAKNSLYWQANVQQTPYLAVYLMAASRPDKLADAPGGTTYLKDLNSPEVVHGKKIFAQNCASCHSSKLPKEAYQIFNDSSDPKKCAGKNYLNCWLAYGQLVQKPEFKAALEKIVLATDFLDDNYLSTDLRIPANVIDTNLCSPIATNALKGNVWDNFSSSSYKDLPGIGTYLVNYPERLSIDNKVNDEITSAEMYPPAGGRGYVRPASLISLWSTAPFLQNNSVGKFDYTGSVAGRMDSFNDSIAKMLRPDLRGNDPTYSEKLVTYKSGRGFKLPGFVDVLTQEAFLKVPLKFVPALVKDAWSKVITQNGGKLEIKDDSVVVTLEKTWDGKTYVSAAEVFTSEAKRNVATSAPVSGLLNSKDALYLKIGPLPKGMPTNLISNIDLTYAGISLSYANLDALAAQARLIDGIAKLSFASAQVNAKSLTGQAALDTFMSIAAKPLIDASKCNDMVVNRGHYFGSKFLSQSITDKDQNDLIEFLKHF